MITTLEFRAREFHLGIELIHCPEFAWQTSTVHPRGLRLPLRMNHACSGNSKRVAVAAERFAEIMPEDVDGELDLF